MTNQLQQKVSELVDGELDAAERGQMYKTLKGNDDLRNDWSRYCLISDAIRRNLPDNPRHDLFKRVSQALESEPALLVPTTQITEQISDTVTDTVAVPAAAFAGSAQRSYRFAVAAAVAAFAVVGALTLSNPEQPMEPEMNTVASSNSVNKPASQSPVAVQPVLVAAPVDSSSAPLQPLPEDAQWERLPQNGVGLDRYLVEHSETSTENSIQRGMLPYARVVSFGESGKQQ